MGKGVLRWVERPDFRGGWVQRTVGMDPQDTWRDVMGERGLWVEAGSRREAGKAEAARGAYSWSTGAVRWPTSQCDGTGGER
ncbi:hypothetical protein E2562_018038 [Oryza meyeriana var. granulata]|uniref:Uncharacterized protein n=1 Tax=Oryza meyeriana var. granulata TaxID=110450 RepID=A0A6G1C5M3_9ORYZ|nr:hypothetical protein E2562_018038 [Oryza meyeriana var. granulata]